MRENKIVDIGDGYTYVINGRVIGFLPSVYDINKPEDAEHLIEFVNGLPTERCFDANFGDFTMYMFMNVSDGILITQGDTRVYLKELPQDVSEKVRQAINEYRGKAGN